MLRYVTRFASTCCCWSGRSTERWDHASVLFPLGSSASWSSGCSWPSLCFYCLACSSGTSWRSGLCSVCSTAQLQTTGASRWTLNHPSVVIMWGFFANGPSKFLASAPRRESHEPVLCQLRYEPRDLTTLSAFLSPATVATPSSSSPCSDW